MCKAQQILLCGKKPRFHLFLGAFLLIGLGGTASLQAQTTTWTGNGADDNWFTNANWNPSVAPILTTSSVTMNTASPTILNGSININSLTTSTGGVLQFNSSTNLDFGGAAITTLNNVGVIAVGNQCRLELSGTANNSGSIALNDTVGGASSSALFVEAGSATLTGGGIATMSGTNALVHGNGGTSLFIANQTIQGHGQIGAGTLRIYNQAGGIIHANSSGKTLTISTPYGFSNDGIIRASNGGRLVLEDFEIVTGGSVEVLAGSEIMRSAYFTSAALVHVAAGGLLSSNSVLQIDPTGTLTGLGTVDGDVFVNGTLAPGDVVLGNLTGTLNLKEYPRLQSNSVFEVQIGSAADFDRIVVHNLFGSQLGSISGTLDIELLNGFNPDSSDIFEILSRSGGGNTGFTGQFSNAMSGQTIMTSDERGQFKVNYEFVSSGSSPISTRVWLSNFQAIPEPGWSAVLMAGMLLAISFRRQRV